MSSRRIHLGGRRTRAGVATFPGQYALTAWWQAAYAGAPWVGVASAGSSGSYNAASIGVDPTSGAALNGLATADFNGALGGSALAVPVALSNFISSARWTLGVLLNADTVTVADATVANNQLLIGDGGGFWGLYASAFGGTKLHAMVNDGTEKSASVALSTGAWVYAHCSFDGATLTIDLGGGATSNVACGPPTNMTNGLRVGRKGSLTSFDGRVASIMCASGGSFSRAQAVQYLNSRYALSLP